MEKMPHCFTYLKMLISESKLLPGVNIPMSSSLFYLLLIVNFSIILTLVVPLFVKTN